MLKISNPYYFMKKFIITFAAILTLSFSVVPGQTSAETPLAATETSTIIQPEAVDDLGSEPGLEESQDVVDESLLGMFGINWKAFIAQLLNFSIVLFVLWKWVFKPVSKGLSDRTTKIEASLAEAERINKDRQTFESWKQSEISDVRIEASHIITAAKQEAEIVKQDIITKAKTEQENMAQDTRNKLLQEKEAILREARNEITELIINATETILQQKIDPAKDKEIIKAALKKAGA